MKSDETPPQKKWFCEYLFRLVGISVIFVYLPYNEEETSC